MAYSTISKPSLHFNTKLYTGTGSELAITGVGFQPDFVWTKSRSNTLNHNLYDAVRGVTKGLKSNTSDAEFTEAQSLKSFDSGGFTIGTDSHINTSSATFASWNWKANGAGSANTDGDINSTVSVNQTAGFSIVSWTGDGNASSTVGHGLGSDGIDMLITKNRNRSSSWYTKHKDLSSDNILLLDSSSGQFSNIGSTWGGLDNLSASSVFGFDAGSSGVFANYSGEEQIAYCFKSVKGYSKFGKYTGNGNANGTFIYTGFKPAFIIIKKTSATQSWTIQDNKRNPINNGGDMKALKADTSGAEEDEASHRIDYLSNGFKMRYNWEGNNQSGATYIYMAFAEEPLVANVGNSIPATAR